MALSGLLRLGLAGYDVGGRLFHAGFIVAVEGIELVGVVIAGLQNGWWGVGERILFDPPPAS